jgi:hypothetical protein
MEGQRLSVVLQRLLLLAETEVHLADIVERRGLHGPIPQGLKDGQRLTVILQRLPKIAELMGKKHPPRRHTASFARSPSVW